MENKNFIINESERERILQKHQDATKNLYLNVISEQGQTFPGGISKEAFDKIISISNENKKNFKGSYLFKPQQENIDKVFGAGTYEKFFKNGGEEVLKNPSRLKDILTSLFKNQKKTSETKTQKTQPNYTSIKNQKLESDTTSIAPIILFKETKFFWNDKGGYSFRDSGENPGLTQVNSGKWRWFSCKTKKFNFGNKGIYVNSQLSNELFTSNDLCRNFLNPKGTKPKTTGSSGASKQGLVKPTDEVITKLINMVK
jgi:hypothetical protein